MYSLSSLQGFFRLVIALVILYFLLQLSILVLALWFVKRLAVKPFAKTMLFIIVVLSILIMIIYLFMGIFLYKQFHSVLNLFKYY